MMWNSADIIGYETIKTLFETLYIRKKKLKTVIWERGWEWVEVKKKTVLVSINEALRYPILLYVASNRDKSS